MNRRYVFFPLFFAILGFSAFVRSAGSDHVRPVQILTLIATGMCLGVGLVNLRALLGAKPQD